uniref:Uncharacterized protein n=1 Tax=Knipowitschia caucasica TaxID=637954 RepID=A0AAV2JU48_KNICA
MILVTHKLLQQEEQREGDKGECGGLQQGFVPEGGVRLRGREEREEREERGGGRGQGRDRSVETLSHYPLIITTETAEREDKSSVHIKPNELSPQGKEERIYICVWLYYGKDGRREGEEGRRRGGEERRR